LYSVLDSRGRKVPDHRTAFNAKTIAFPTVSAALQSSLFCSNTGSCVRHISRVDTALDL